MRGGLIVVWLAACGPPATVEVEGIPEFGEAASATWTLSGPEYELWLIDRSTGRLRDYAMGVFTTLEVSDDAWGCVDAARDRRAVAEASAALIARVGDGGDVRDACAEMTALRDAETARPAGRHVFDAIFNVERRDPRVPEPGVYPSNQNAISGALIYGGDRSGCANWDADRCEFVTGRGGCESSVWLTTDETFVIDGGRGAVRGEYDATLDAYPSGEAAGSVHVAFRAAVCTAPEVEALVYL